MARASKATKVKIVLTVLIIAADFLLVPQLLRFLKYFSLYKIEAPTKFVQELDFWNNVLMLGEKEVYMPFLFIQPGVILLIILMFWNDGFLKKKSGVSNYFGAPEAAGSGEYGTSRWLTRKELDRIVTTWYMRLNKKGIIEPPMAQKNPFAKKRKELKEMIVKGGNVIGVDLESNKVWIDTDDTNTLVVGTSRSRKTTSFLFPTIWEMGKTGESMIITDPKGEIHEFTHTYLKQQGYDVILIDFRSPGRGNHWNVMHPVNKAIKDGDFAKASEAASNIAHSIVYQTERKGDPVWANGEKSVIEATILALATSDAREDQKNISNVYLNIIELGEPVVQELDGNFFEVIPLNEYFKSLPPGHVAKNAFGVAALSPEKQRGSFFSGAASNLRLFSDPNMSFLTKIQDHDMKNIGRKPTVVYLCIPDENTNKHVLASLYVSQVYEALVEEANDCGGRLKNRVNNLLDEFGNMPSIPDFDTKATVSLGRGIRWTLMVQDLQQLKKRYGDNATTITGNCHTWIYLLTTDIKTAEEISKKTGDYTIETESRSSSIQNKGSSRSMSEGLAKRNLLTPDEVLRWPAEKSLVFMARHHPASLDLPHISRWSFAMSELNKCKLEASKEIIPSEVYILGQNNGDYDKRSEEKKEEENSDPRGVFASFYNQ